MFVSETLLFGKSFPARQRLGCRKWFGTWQKRRCGWQTDDVGTQVTWQTGERQEEGTSGVDGEFFNAEFGVGVERFRRDRSGIQNAQITNVIFKSFSVCSISPNEVVMSRIS